jgi:hypothetical protein
MVECLFLGPKSINKSPFMNPRFLLIWLFLAISALAYAQDDQPENELVLYDPLFWKEQLRLDDDQCQRIKEINSHYYETLSAVVQDEPDHKTARALVEETLVQRSEGIWETFYPRQRKRWKKIWQDKDRT